MKPFHFRFQKILDWREHLETQEKHKFARVLKKYADKENELKEKERQQKLFLVNSRELLDRGEIGSIIWRDKSRHALGRGIEDKTVELKEEARKLEVARRELVEFTRKKKIMEKLKEKDHEKYRVEMKNIDKKISSEIGQNISNRKKLLEKNEERL